MMQVLTSKILKEFGLITGGILAIMFGALLPWLFGHDFPVWPWVSGGVLIILGLLVPKVLTPFYHVWMKIGHVLGWINTRIVLGSVFFLLFVPFGLIMRLFGKDPMARKLEQRANSYRVKSEKSNIKNMVNPF